MFEPKWTLTTYERIPYAPHNSTMHDERCSCPWCLPDEPGEFDEAQETAAWEEEWKQRNNVRDAWNALQGVPSYVEREADAQGGARIS